MVHVVFPDLRLLVQQVTIPIDNLQDRLVWKNTPTDELSFKEAFIFKSQAGQNVSLD